MKKMNIPLMATLLALSIIVCPVLYFTVGPALDSTQVEVIKILLIIAGCSAAFCFIVGELTGNNSQMDKLWSLLPIAYTWVIAAKGGMNARLVVMAVLATLWGLRLTFNFARKGAYKLKFWEGTEDYRWAVLRSGPAFSKRWTWTLFDLGFISGYQNALVLMTTFPALVAMRSDAPFGPVDWIAAVIMLAFIIWETVADEQQWTFQTRKWAMIDQGKTLEELPAPYNKGFNTTGLWGRSRHPNYLAEQSIWIAFYVFSIGAGIGIINWSVIGALLLVVMFQGSSALAEEISGGKYPEYQKYCQSVPRFLPGKKYSASGTNASLMLVAILSVCGLTVLSSCSDDDDDPIDTPADAIELQLKQMTLREKVGQMFYVRPECLDTTIHFNQSGGIDASVVSLADIKLQAVNSTMRAVNEDYPVGGIILYAHNIEDETQLAQFIPQIRSLKGSPLLCIDEEGGRVARIGRNSNFNVKTYESMGSIGATGDPANAYECGNTIGTYLKRYGFDIDFAPVADVNTNPENIVIGPRAFSDDPAVAAPMVTNYLQGLKDAGITGCIKHFPGHGDTQTDSHYGYASSQKTWAQMLDCEMITFKAGIRWGCQLIMTAHVSAPNVIGSDIPSTMSSVILKDKLRQELGYQNIIITDAMEMGAITQQYSNAEAAVGCIQAGVDIVLGPQNFVGAFDAVVAAVNNGTLTEERINQSVRRILKLKQQITR